jgi:hypothetical protein
VPCHLATPQYRPAQIIPERLFAVRTEVILEMPGFGTRSGRNDQLHILLK